MPTKRRSQRVGLVNIVNYFWEGFVTTDISNKILFTQSLGHGLGNPNVVPYCRLMQVRPYEAKLPQFPFFNSEGVDFVRSGHEF